MLGFVSFNEEAEQYLCAAVLRPGNVTADSRNTRLVGRSDSFRAPLQAAMYAWATMSVIAMTVAK